MCLLVVLLFVACIHKKENEAVITVTMEPLRFFAEQIAGDKFKVVSLVPEGTSPETYDPSPLQIVDMANSKAYFLSGRLGFEESLLPRVSENCPDIKIFDTSVGVPIIESDPHVWNSPANALIIAGNIRDALCGLDSANATFYCENYNQLRRTITSTDSIITSLLSCVNNRSFLIYHPALTYFAKEYNLFQVSIEEEGKEPSASQLVEIIDSCKQLSTRIVFVQREFDERNAQAIAQELNAQLVVINPLSYHWAEEMVHIAQSLKLYNCE